MSGNGAYASTARPAYRNRICDAPTTNSSSAC